MPTVITNRAHSTDYTGSGVNDNDIVIQTDVVERHGAFTVMSTAGAMDVFASLDGTNYATAPLSLQDMGSVLSDPVIVTAPNRIYGFRGVFAGIRVLQNGVTGVVNAVLKAGEV